MTQKQLLRTQKDDLFKLISERGFNPKDFQWNSFNELPTLLYNPKNMVYQSLVDIYFIQFEVSQNFARRRLTYSPGEGELVHTQESGLDYWLDYLAEFNKWLSNLKTELDAENLWEKIRTIDKTMSISEVVTEDNISDVEQKIIGDKIETIKTRISEIDIGEDQLKAIESRLDHLVNLTKKLGLKDWLLLFGSTLIDVFREQALPPDVISTIWHEVMLQFEMWLALPY